MKKSAFSVFIEELAGHSVALDNSVTNEDFGELQKLESRIINAYQDGAFPSHAVYKSLYNIAMALHKNYEAALGLDR